MDRLTQQKKKGNMIEIAYSLLLLTGKQLKMQLLRLMWRANVFVLDEVNSLLKCEKEKHLTL